MEQINKLISQIENEIADKELDDYDYREYEKELEDYVLDSWGF